MLGNFPLTSLLSQRLMDSRLASFLFAIFEDANGKKPNAMVGQVENLRGAPQVSEDWHGCIPKASSESHKGKA
jgi:hypothetical protein